MKKILFIVIGVLLIGVVSIKASELIESSQVIYKDNNTVSTALDELFQAVDINERLGDTDISGIGDGTVTGAISELNNLNSCINGRAIILTIPSDSSDNTVFETTLPENVQGKYTYAIAHVIGRWGTLSVLNTTISGNKIIIKTNYLGTTELRVSFLVLLF